MKDHTKDPLDVLVMSEDESRRYRLAEYLRRMPDDLMALFKKEFQRMALPNPGLQAVGEQRAAKRPAHQKRAGKRARA